MSSTVFGILIGIVGIALGAVGVYFSRLALQRGRLVCVTVNVLDIFRTVARKFPNLTIEYKKDLVQSPLVFYLGTLVNSSRTDISKEMLKQPLKLILPEGFRWLEVSINEQKTKTNASYSIENGRILAFTADLLKPNEAIFFEALAQAPQAIDDAAKSLDKNLTFNSRVTNTELKRMSVQQLSSSRQAGGMTIFFLVATLLLGSVPFIESLIPLELVMYEGKDELGNNVRGRLVIEDGGGVRIETGNPTTFGRIRALFSDENIVDRYNSLDEFTASDTWRPVIGIIRGGEGTSRGGEGTSRSEAIVWLIMMPASVGALIFCFVRYSRHRQLLRILKQ